MLDYRVIRSLSLFPFTSEENKMDNVEGLIILCFQVILLLLFFFFGEYQVNFEFDRYPMYQDIHSMVFVGFGFLMSFLRRYSFSALGFNFLLGALMIQWSIICRGFFNITEDTKITVNVESLIQADIATCTTLISMGAILGYTTYLQIIIMGTIEIVLYSFNCYLGSTIFLTSDAGGSVSIHCFGAYFGLALSYSLRRRQKTTSSTLYTSKYTSDIFAMIGTLFLWVYWPSFNAVGLSEDQQQLAIINTYLSLASCCVTTFIISPFFTSDGKFDMLHIQNATLAGGVSIGAAANLLVQPYGAVAIGFLAAFLAVYGYSRITPWLSIHWRIIDTCGVHNLHGIPGIFGGLIGAFMSAVATKDEYHGNLHTIVPARIPDGNFNFTSGNENIEVYQDRSTVEQAGFQLLSLLVTILIAIVSGAITGILLKLKKLNLNSNQFYNDELFWNINDDDAINSNATINVRQKQHTEMKRLQLIPT